MTTHRTSLEPLEARIAPAAVFTFIDVDGDKVSIVATRGDNDSLADAVTLGSAIVITLDDSFAGTSINIQAKRMNGGDGHVNIGLIDATDIDLKNVTVDGDLGAILAGDGDDTAPAISRLHIGSLAAVAADQDFGDSQIDEALSIRILHDCFGTFNAGSIGKLKIGGSLGSDSLVSGDSQRGSITVQDGIESVIIGGNIASDFEDAGGQIISDGPIGTLIIRGSLIGDESFNGLVEATSFGTIKIGGSIIGESRGGGPCGAIIATEGGIGSLTIKGSIISSSDEAGYVDAVGSIGAIQIGGGILATVDDVGQSSFYYALTPDGIGGAFIHSGGDIGSILVGGSVGGLKSPGGLDALYAPSLSGGILADGRIDFVAIGGDLVGGGNNDTDPDDGATDYCGFVKAHALGTVNVAGSVLSSQFGLVKHNGVIQSDTTIDSIGIGGNLFGNNSANLLAGGRGTVSTTGTGTDLAIGSIFIGGRVKNAGILAGYITDFDDYDDSGYSHPDIGVDADAQIGPVTIGKSWQHSFLAAGVDTGADHRFATDDDAKLSGPGIHDDPAILSQIASITLGGHLLGSGLGFVAENIAAIHIPGVSYHLHAGAHNDHPNLGGHARLLEV